MVFPFSTPPCSALARRAAARSALRPPWRRRQRSAPPSAAAAKAHGAPPVRSIGCCHVWLVCWFVVVCFFCFEWSSWFLWGVVWRGGCLRKWKQTAWGSFPSHCSSPKPSSEAPLRAPRSKAMRCRSILISSNSFGKNFRRHCLTRMAQEVIPKTKAGVGYGPKD